MKKVAVHIVTFNSEDDIKPCIEAVLGQSHPVHSIIVVDNHSHDHTCKVVKSFGPKTVTLIENKANTGFTGGHNLAIQENPDADYVLVLNPDVTLHPDYIKAIITEMEQDPTIGMATGKLYRDSGNKILDTTGINIKKNFRAYDRGSGETDTGQYDGKTAIFGVSGAAAVYRYEMINAVSINHEFYDDHFFAYKEDIDVSWRANITGWKAVFVPDATATHERGWAVSKSRTDISLKIRQHSYINRYYFMVKNCPLLTLVRFLPAILLYEFCQNSYILIKEPQILSIWREFRKNRKQMQKARRLIQAQRSVSAEKIRTYFKGIW
ncbi:glycosyltransferase family 2 protein [Virgibacillus siamensis]|uniref:glycosyltransferase family 2 protein n=1 Tax=Virgibacillus siamensis TaxID=480071 RepID=UPI0009863CF5|nr:glycosyltransferase family 2 protein [Virgibacillus siamensis]